MNKPLIIIVLCLFLGVSMAKEPYMKNKTKSPYEIALGFKNIKEHSGILKMFLGFDPQKYAWCSGFMNSVFKKAGIELNPKKTTLMARSYLNHGRAIKNPIPGDVVVLSRGKAPFGHVGMFVRFSDDKKKVYVLGGNQDNTVKIKAYNSKRILGFRRIK